VTDEQRASKNKRGREYHARHRERLNERKRMYNLRNKERQSEYGREYRNKNPIKELHRKAKERAIAKNIPFDIDPLDITFPEICPILGIKLEVGDGKMRDSSPTLDRIIPELGYVKGNVSVISNKANRMKSDASTEEIKLFLRNIPLYIGIL
jgi:hypothetical protein